jgi:drug/metabolite transporter (DMT)-like permease
VTTISVAVTLLVLAAGFVHAVWNAIAKSFKDQWTSFTLLNVGVAVPCLIGLPLLGLPVRAAWGYLAASVLCHLTYEVFLMEAYRHGSLSSSYPIARGVAPMLTTFGALVFANEDISGAALGGISLVVAGIVSIALLDRLGTSRRAVGWALLTGVAIAVYTLIDGLGVRVSHSPLKYACTLFAIQGTLFVVGAMARRPPNWRPSLRRSALGVFGGWLSLVGYGTILYAQTRAPLGVVSALRETGVIWATLIGVLFFKERGSWRVVISAATVLAGVTLIALS